MVRRLRHHGTAATPVGRAGGAWVRARRGGVFVSVSGRGPITGLAVSRAPIGIDLEPLDTEGPIPWAVLSAAERGLVEAVAEGERTATFLGHWTAEEAVLRRSAPACCTIRRTWRPARPEQAALRFSMLAGRPQGRGPDFTAKSRNPAWLLPGSLPAMLKPASRTGLRNRSETGRPRSQAPGRPFVRSPHEPMFACDAPRPPAGHFVSQRFRLSDASKRTAGGISDQIVEARQYFAIGLLPIRIVGPGLLGSKQLHGSTRLCSASLPAFASVIEFRRC